MGVSPVFYTRIDADTISSKKECYEIMDEVCEYIKENYPVIEIECVQYDLSSMLGSEICLLYGITYNSIITELWGTCKFSWYKI